MYAKHLTIKDFKSFGEAVANFNFPKGAQGATQFENVNLVLGNNGSGKSSLLRAIALTILGPVLKESGFVPYYLVRRPNSRNSNLRLSGMIGNLESFETPGVNLPNELELTTSIERSKGGGSQDRISFSNEYQHVEDLLFDDGSPALFLVGYGATRRVEGGDYVESSIRKSRGMRYQRVAGLFEDHIPLRPLASWFRKLKKGRLAEVLDIFAKLLPTNVHFSGKQNDDGDYLFELNGAEIPFGALSDGYKAYTGWTSDLVGNLVDVCPKEMPLLGVPGIVLIDEIDLHLHPDWQRRVVSQLATTFPALQFVMSTHSPLIVGSVQKENILVTANDVEGSTEISDFQESTYGRSVEQLLMSSYFGLETTRPETFMKTSEVLFDKTAEGEPRAALNFLRQMSQAPEDSVELTEHFRLAEKAKFEKAKAHFSTNLSRFMRLAAPIYEYAPSLKSLAYVAFGSLIGASFFVFEFSEIWLVMSEFLYDFAGQR